MRATDHRRNEVGRKTHDPKQLWQSSHEILSLLLLGHKEVDVARLVGVTPQTVSNIANSTLGMAKLSAMRQDRDKQTIDVSKRAAELYEKAMIAYEKILDGSDDKLKKETADTIIMDIGGYRSPTKIQGQFQGQVVHDHVISDLVSRGREAARANGMLVEVPKQIENKEGEK